MTQEKTTKKRLSKAVTVILATVIVGVSIVMLGLFIRSGLSSFPTNQRVVEVRGLCEREVEANKVTWPIVSKTVGNDLIALYQEVERTNSAIIQFLKNNGITDDEITTDAPSVTDMQAESYNGEHTPFRYRVTTVVVVTSSKVKEVNSLMKRQTQLMQQGIAIVAGDYNYQTLYEYTDLNKIKPEMIAEATKNAREAANKFAEDSGSEIGSIQTATQGQFSIENRDAYTPYIKKIRVVSYITYFLKD